MQSISKLSDEELVALVRLKDKEIYSEIINRYQNKLLRYASYLTGDESEVADVVQNAFIKAYINLNGFNPKKKFSSWLYRIVHNESMNVVSRKKYHYPLDDGLEVDSGIAIEEDLIKKELIEHTKKCLKQIPLKYREPISLYYLEGKTYEEISDILRIPMGTVAVRINRAKTLMKKICIGDGKYVI